MPVVHAVASLERLRALAAGLVYSSEGDRPFEAVRFPHAEAGALTEEGIRRLLSVAEEAPVALISLQRALGRHTVFTDPLDLQAQAIRPRYEAITRFFEDELADSVVVRTGSSPTVDVWFLGRTEDDELVGYHTVAVET